MYLFILKSILGSIVGSSFYSWWQNTRLGIWFQNKLDDTLDRLDWEILAKEDKWKKAYPNLADRLEDLSSQSPSNTTLNLISMEISALTMFKKGQEEEAVALLMEAVSVAENQSPPRGAASPLKPVHELAGDLLLAMGSHDKAAELYETSLGRMANRPRALLGAARSYAGMSDEYNARQKFQAFYSLWKDTDIAAVDEVEDYLGL